MNSAMKSSFLRQSTEPTHTKSRNSLFSPWGFQPSAGWTRLIRIAANLVGALGAALFARAGLEHYLATRSLIGGAFFGEQLWIVVAYLLRRPAELVTTRTGDWLLAFGGTFGGVLLRPTGVHSHWGITAGLIVQIIGLALCVTSFAALGRSFGFAAANRGLVRRGPYAIVRHPIYTSYFLLLGGYVMQSLSVRNVLVVVLVLGCDVGRALAEERLLASSGSYDDYRDRTPWRLCPRIW